VVADAGRLPDAARSIFRELNPEMSPDEVVAAVTCAQTPSSPCSNATVASVRLR
jgi:hypothetical protein